MNPPPRDRDPKGIPPTDAVHLFNMLVKATAARDFRTATAARKALRRFGWAVAPCSKGAT